MDQFNSAHDESEICLIQNDYNDPFNVDRTSFYGVNAWPTMVGDGVSDVYPSSCFEPDYEAHNAIPSPMTLTISEQGQGEFTVHITAEEDIENAVFFMVATLDEEVPNYGGGLSHLPHHVKVHMTPPDTGAPFTLMAGQSIDISHSFVVQPEWDYELMGVAAWVSRPGGTNPSSCTYGDMPNMNETLQSRWVPAGADLTAIEDTAPNPSEGLYNLSAMPNPFNPTTTVTYELTETATVSLQVYDLAGRLVDRLVVGESQSAGRHSVSWDGQDRNGRQLSSGVYFCRLEAGGHAEIMRMVLIR